MIKFAIKSRYLDYNNKWHQRTSKWYDDLNDAWLDEERWEKTIKYLELANATCHKEVNV